MQWFQHYSEARHELLRPCCLNAALPFHIPWQADDDAPNRVALDERKDFWDDCFDTIVLLGYV